jgi:hypothetical protein
MRLPQLTLRDLFWLLLVCALAVGWWINQRALGPLTKELHQLRSESQEWQHFRGRYKEIKDELTRRTKELDEREAALSSRSK